MGKKYLRVYFPLTQTFHDQSTLYGCNLLSADSACTTQCLIILGAFPLPCVATSEEQLNAISKSHEFKERLDRVNGELVICGAVGESETAPKKAGLWTCWKNRGGNLQLVRLWGDDRPQLVQVSTVH